MNASLSRHRLTACECLRTISRVRTRTSANITGTMSLVHSQHQSRMFAKAIPLAKLHVFKPLTVMLSLSKPCVGNYHGQLGNQDIPAKMCCYSHPSRPYSWLPFSTNALKFGLISTLWLRRSWYLKGYLIWLIAASALAIHLPQKSLFSIDHHWIQQKLCQSKKRLHFSVALVGVLSVTLDHPLLMKRLSCLILFSPTSTSESKFLLFFSSRHCLALVNSLFVVPTLISSSYGYNEPEQPKCL